MRWSSAFVLAASPLCLASPFVSKRWDDVELLTKHSWNEVPRGWFYKAAPSPDHVLDMRIGLKKANAGALVSSLYEVSDPRHERYGKHLSKQDVDALVAPHADTVDAVESWLRFHGIEPSNALFRSSGGNWLTVTVTVAQAERMLGTTYGVYEHSESDASVIRTLSYALPAELHDHIAVMAPTTYFSTTRTFRATSFVQEDIVDDGDRKVSDQALTAGLPSSCNTAITIDCLQALYNTADYTPTQTDVNKLGVAGYLDEYANRNDLQTFLQQYRPDAAGAEYDTVSIKDGGDDQSDPGIEANLDIQYTVGMSYPTPNIYYSTGGSPPFNPDTQTPTNTNEPYLDWLNYILSQDEIPQTITTSYGDDEQTVPLEYADSVCELLAELGARGTTVFFSSGDFGVGGGDCQTNDGKNQTLFQPAFPASCPYVTTVGGTTGVEPEQAVDFSGGGFSNYFGVPSYQSQVVSDYVKGLDGQYDGLYNTSGRAYPDLAAQGSGFRVVVGGRIRSVGGTSASSPTVAGIFALLNDYRLSKNLTSLGFINPLIYANPDGFNDITNGTNPGCGTEGFASKEGWDPVTGLGTPDFKKLQDIVASAE